MLDYLMVEAEARREWPPFHPANPYLTAASYFSPDEGYDYLVGRGPTQVGSLRMERTQGLRRIAQALGDVSYTERRLSQTIKEREEARAEWREHPRRRSAYRRWQEAGRAVRRLRRAARLATEATTVARAEIPEDVFELSFPRYEPEEGMR